MGFFFLEESLARRRGRNPGRARKERRRAEAEERKLSRESRSLQQQLERLDRMFGKDKGAQKERRKLEKKLN